MSDVWVAGDTTPKAFTIGGTDLDLTDATAVVATLSHDEDDTVDDVDLATTVLDATTLQLARPADLVSGLWALEVEVTWPQGEQTFPERRPRYVLVRDDITPGA